MTDEEKKPPTPPPGAGAAGPGPAGGEKPAAPAGGEKPPAAAGGEKPPAPAGAEKPTAPAGAEKPAAAAPGPAAPPKPPAGPTPQPWDDDFVRRVRERLGGAIKESLTYLGQNFLVVEASSIVSICGYLKHEEQFDFLADLTALDYPKREKRFEVIYQLYSFPRNVRLRLKAPLGETETIESVTTVWKAANWLEREAYDMFGIRFAGHPDLRRILLPEEWQGHPLRKDYSIIQQDVQWVQENLHIESGQ
jgi:NADH-quinone oxidoreductase subunit C